MTLNEALPLAVLASSLLPGLIIFVLPAARVRRRTGLNLFGATAKLILGVLGLAPAFRRQVIAEGPAGGSGA